MNKQLTIICIIGMLLTVGLSGCFEEEPKISNKIKIQVLVVFKYLNNESYWEWNNESYIIVVHEDEYFGVPDDSIIVSNKTYCNVSDGKQMFKLMRIINGSNVIIEFNESVFYNYTLQTDFSHYNPAKDPSWDIITIYTENPLNLSTQERVFYPIRGNIIYVNWFGGPNCHVKVYLKVIDESEKNKETDFSNVYEAINGTTFRSIRMLSGGLGPNGPVFRYWVISFHNETYSWEFSDIVEAGIYECDGWNITGYSIFHDGKYFGYYNKEIGILLWDGEEYKTYNTIKLQVLVVSKHLVDLTNLTWEWSNESYVIDVHEGEYFGISNISGLVSKIPPLKIWNITDGSTLFKLVQIINSTNVMVWWNESALYNISSSEENPILISTNEQIFAPKYGNLIIDPRPSVSILIKIIN